jgi:hypothetical protein
LSFVKPRAALQTIEPGQAFPIHPIKLPADAAIPRDRHRERTQVMENQPWQFGVSQPAGLRQAVVVHLAALEGAVDEHGLLRLIHHATSRPGSGGEPASVNRAPSPTILDGPGSVEAASTPMPRLGGGCRHAEPIMRGLCPALPAMTIALLIALAASLALMIVIVKRLENA